MSRVWYHIGVDMKKRYALGRLKSGERNRLEASYEQMLKVRESVGDILWYSFEGLKLRLADRTYLTVDFFLMLANGELEAHECKGFMEGDALVKIKVAASMYPFRFYVVRARLKRDGGGFSVSEV